MRWKDRKKCRKSLPYQYNYFRPKTEIGLERYIWQVEEGWMAAAAIHFQILHNKGLPHIPPLIAAIVWEITMRKNLIYFKQIWSDSYKTNLTFFILTVLKKELKWFSSSSLLLFFLSVNTPWQAKCSWPIKEFLSTPTQSIFVLIIPYLTFSAVRDFLYFENSILPCSISSRSFPITTKCVLFHVPRYSLLDNKKNERSFG